MVRVQFVAGGQYVIAQFVRPSIYIDGYDPAVVSRLDLGADLAFVKLVTESGMLFLTSSSLTHDLALQFRFATELYIRHAQLNI